MKPGLSLYIAWLLALAASLAVLFIGEVLGQSPCVLCWFQRAFMFPLAMVLGIAVWANDKGVWKYGGPCSCGAPRCELAGPHFASTLPWAAQP